MAERQEPSGQNRDTLISSPRFSLLELWGSYGYVGLTFLTAFPSYSLLGELGWRTNNRLALHPCFKYPGGLRVEPHFVTVEEPR